MKLWRAYTHSRLYILRCAAGILQQSHLYSANKVSLMSLFYVALPASEPAKGLRPRAKTQ